MFGLIRLIFFLFIVGMGYCWFKWKVTRENRWLTHFHSLLKTSLGLLLIIAITLIATRLL